VVDLVMTSFLLREAELSTSPARMDSIQG
jgi:hypothetical protein